MFSPEQRRALSISAPNVAPFKPCKYKDLMVGKTLKLLGTGMAAGRDSPTALLHPLLRSWEMSLQPVLQPEEKAVLLTHCPPTQPASLQFVHGVQRRWAPKRMLN